MLELLTSKILVKATLIALLLSVFSCDNIKRDDPDPASPRTVLVYMAANCNLGREGYDALDLDEMLRGVRNGDAGYGRLLVYHAAYRSDPVLKEVTKDGIIELKKYDSGLSSLDIERMRGVIADVKSIAPAKSYGIVFWSHGTTWRESSSSRSASGIEGSRSFTDNGPIAYSYGVDGTREMKLTSLAKALEGNRFDFIYFDVCHMATVEAAYEFRHAAEVLVGSTTELDLLGMPYHLNLKYMFADTPDMVGAAQSTLNYYTENPRSGCSMSVINLDALDRLAEATKRIYQSGVDLPYSFTGVPYYRVSSPCLVYDYGHYIRALRPEQELLDEWEAAYKETVVWKGATDRSYGFDMSQFTGLGSFIMFSQPDSLTDGYNNQSWFKDVARYAVSH